MCQLFACLFKCNEYHDYYIYSLLHTAQENLLRAPRVVEAPGLAQLAHLDGKSSYV